MNPSNETLQLWCQALARCSPPALVRCAPSELVLVILSVDLHCLAKCLTGRRQ